METRNSDLLFNIAQLLKEPVGSTRKYDLETEELRLDDEEAGAELLAARDLHGKVKVTRISDGVLVQGDVAAKVELECSRCLESFTLPVEGSLEEEFQPTIDVESGMPVRRADYEKNDAAFQVDANHQMDLAEPVRQALLVSLPMKPLCREDCKGICPQCGAYWNEADCDCEVETVDSRWGSLRELSLEDFPAGEQRLN